MVLFLNQHEAFVPCLIFLEAKIFKTQVFYLSKSNKSTIDFQNNDNYFPFHTLTNSEFETFGSRTRLSQSDMDRLSQLKFNPFQTNQNIVLSDSNIDFVMKPMVKISLLE